MIAAPLFAYLIGSIPFGLVLTKLAGHGDIRKIGSGNIGATNVLRTGNKPLAALTLFLDAGKGAFLILLMFGFLPLFPPEFAQRATSVSPDAHHMPALAAGFFVILGHCFPVWLKFKGGKGVATTLGTLLAAVPIAGAAACIAWLLAALAFRISSLSALIAMGVAPLITLIIYGPGAAVVNLMISALVFFRHKDNIMRMRQGEEPKIGKKNEPAKASE